MGVPKEWRAVVRKSYKHISVKIKTKEEFSNSFSSDVEVKQVCAISPLLFVLYIDKSKG